MSQPVSTLSDADRLRLYLGERVPEDGTDLDTFFDDDTIASLLLDAHGVVLLAAWRGWTMKASQFARLIDVDEQGSDRKLSQRYRNALSQAQFFQKMYEEFVLATTGAARTVGRTVAWTRDNDNRCRVPYGMYFTEAEYAVLERSGYWANVGRTM